jgi:citronellyl-CoA dehydrogenase
MLFSPEHEVFRQTVRRFVERELNPHVDAWERAQAFPAHDIFNKLGALGLLGITKPTDFGGLALDASYTVVFAEELGRCNCGAVPMAIGVATDMATPALARFGSDELRREFLAPTIAGDMVCAIAVSEPGAGSDVAALKTTARRDGDDYLLDGTKMWITNGLQADWLCLLANTSDGHPHRNKSMLVVPTNLPGISRTPIHKLGMWASDTAQIFLDGVRIPARYRIGEEGAGFLMQMAQFQEERMFVAAQAVSAYEKMVEQTIAYARQREIFGAPLLDQQTVHFRLAELQTEIESLRALVHTTCERFVANPNDLEVVKLASMCKLKAGRLGREVPDACLQYWGGNGFTWENPLARAYRDMRLLSIGGGADEVMLGIICKLTGTLPGKKG